MPVPHPDPIWVTDNDTLATYCTQWLKLDAIALDTEFIRTDTFYPKPGLIQLGTGQEVFLLDPVTIDNWQPFAQLLNSEEVVKVLHACSEDIEVFHLLTGKKPAAMFDTQLAASYAGLGHSLGYQNLLKTLLDIDLPKDATRSDWLQRPLTDVQVSYATLDVVHLLEVYQLLKERLQPLPQWHWLLEDCANLSKGDLYPDPEEQWKEVKRAWQLRPKQLCVLKALAEYREREARRSNVPRNRVIPKGSLWPLARYMPDNARSLSAIQDMRHTVIRHYGEEILSLIKMASELPREQYPEPLPAPLPKSAKEHGKQVKQYTSEKAQELNISVELLMLNKLLSSLLRSRLEHGQFIVPEQARGWRREVFVEPMIEQLNQPEQ
ncbi:hypothetical protein GZ77_14570 [Endozoicomonas montiporae]|uniref:Ribonuclease D n=2 Tax=Endozoicomonas montiporae TaxID=1027273 RepID=A0A081N525_9GAMM|nr:ribonuclease D [Endozoicomonas montiporae]AMO57575.1 ribonuclease D [Endozoicomonas montiporae CL-33]KEQ13548.1 hypothetical protein GZ77_14570 [Endozoicomonas montiporae]